MTMKITGTVIAIALVAGAPSVAAAASLPQGARSTQSQTSLQRVAQRAFNAGYKAGLRQNVSASALRTAYNRGYRDAMNGVAYNARGYIGNSYARSAVAADSNGYSAYARYDGDGRDAYASAATVGYSSSGRYYGGYGDSARSAPYARYDGEFNPIGGFLNQVFAPFNGAEQTAQNERLAYCSARYRSFDAASGTFLAYDGNRYYCS